MDFVSPIMCVIFGNPNERGLRILLSVGHGVKYDGRIGLKSAAIPVRSIVLRGPVVGGYPSVQGIHDDCNETQEERKDAQVKENVEDAEHG